jgi:hypothetical protein
MRLRNIRRQLERLLNRNSDRKIAEHRKRARELEKAFHELNAAIPGLNAAAVDAGESENPERLAAVLQALAANYAASAIVLSQWAGVCESASKLAAER